MEPQPNPNPKRLSLNPSDFQGALPKAVLAPLLGPVNKLCGLSRLDSLYDNIAGGQQCPAFISAALKELGVEYQISAEDLKRLPAEGPLMVMANHPYGGLEGLILADIMLSVRPDVKILVNRLLGRVSELRDLFLFVDPFKSTPDTRRFNIAALRETVLHLKSGGALGLFPAGEVAHWSMRDMAVNEPRWQPNMARFITAGEAATVAPVFFSGHNGPLFQVLGLIHPTLRTAALPRELANKQKSSIRVSIGRPISSAYLKSLGSVEEIMEHLRSRTMLLSQRDRGEGGRPRIFPVPAKRRQAPLIAPVEPGLLAAEIEKLPPDQILFHSDDFMAAYARRDEIPLTMVEISRLRELSFRAAGEGTGEGRDTDKFDAYYTQLFVWNKVKREIVGAYRLAQTDQVIAAMGMKGLYSSTLFKVKPDFHKHLGPALELGRSFVRPEYQKDYAPLYLLWKGISAYVLKNPRYKTLFGLVSISNDYKAISRQLMAAFYEKSARESELIHLVSPKNAFPVPRRTRRFSEVLKTDQDLNAVLGDIEMGGAAPVLLRHYMKLGGSVLKFTLDPSFSKTLDGLIIVDLSRTESKYLARYMGQTEARLFKEYHAPQNVNIV